jgi:hypothetical protein
MSSSSSADDVKLMSSYDSLRATLLGGQYADRLDRKLAFWALPSDRRLPTALLANTLRDLLKHPYKELAATAGIGRKKLETFVKLLVRATKEDATNTTLDQIHATEGVPTVGPGCRWQVRSAAGLRMLWGRWREAARRHGLGPGNARDA